MYVSIRLKKFQLAKKKNQNKNDLRNSKAVQRAFFQTLFDTPSSYHILFPRNFFLRTGFFFLFLILLRAI